MKVFFFKYLDKTRWMGKGKSYVLGPVFLSVRLFILICLDFHFLFACLFVFVFVVCLYSHLLFVCICWYFYLLFGVAHNLAPTLWQQLISMCLDCYLLFACLFVSVEIYICCLFVFVEIPICCLALVAIWHPHCG